VTENFTAIFLTAVSQTPTYLLHTALRYP